MVLFRNLVALPFIAWLSVHHTDGLNNGLALKPPMGYNNYMGKTPVMTIAKYFLKSGMINSGYEYVNSDEGWEEKDRDNTTGKIVPTAAFTGGKSMEDFVKSIHAMGLKLGIYGAASGVTCGNMPGQLYHEDIDAQTYADWGIDYLKSDNCASYALDSSVRFGAMRDALNRTGKKIVLSIEPFSVDVDPEQSVKVANLWRIHCDIASNYNDITNRADISDKWSPLAGSGGWNDPDMINVKNPPALSFGENRIYFGLWSIMKAPLLLSSDLPTLVPELIAIVNNTEVIAMNQDDLGVQARKLAVDGAPLPWLVGLADCAAAPKTFRNRNAGFEDTGVDDTRQWSVQQLPKTKTEHQQQYTLKSLSTGRCLSAYNNSPGAPASAVVLLPCDAADPNQAFSFGQGLHSPSSVYSVATGGALAVSNATLHGQIYGKDAFPVPSTAYGDTVLQLVPRYEQDGCTSRDCQNYDDTQMWYFDPVEQMLRASTYYASVNHKNDGHGYTLTEKVPTYRHHCLAHVLSVANQGTMVGTTEVWGGPLHGGDYVMAAINRGSTANATIAVMWEALGIPSVTLATKFDVRDTWAKKTIFTAKLGGFQANVGPHDIQIYRLSPSN